MILAVLQARMSSTRLPGKVLMPILREPMIVRQIERVARSRRIDKLVVATSDQPDDDAFEPPCAARASPCIAGPLDNVLQRFVGALDAHPADHVVRLTADCPLADP
jgi:spore coat polysaccharide biosynthesis protein SpsF